MPPGNHEVFAAGLCSATVRRHVFCLAPVATQRSSNLLNPPRGLVIIIFSVEATRPDAGEGRIDWTHPMPFIG